MKKIVTLRSIGLLGFILALSSCVGNYRCDCTINGLHYTAANYDNVLKRAAKDECADIEATNRVLLDPNSDCTLERD